MINNNLYKKISKYNECIILLLLVYNYSEVCSSMSVKCSKYLC